MDPRQRLTSLDALRGFDMLFIMGLASLITAICNLFPGGNGCWLTTQMSHVSWEGLRHHDTIFPLFLFISGISFPFSYARQCEKGALRGTIALRILRRGFILVLLGLVYNGIFNLDLAHVRFCSVLARIGLGWMFAALLYVFCKTGARAVIAAAILVGYWAVLRFIPAPDFTEAARFSVEGNFAGYIDRIVMPSHLPYLEGLMDPEGLLSTFPGIVTAMLGMFTGEFVRVPEEKISGDRKALYMLGAAALMLATGLLWSLDFPIIKALWTSTFVLVVGAYSLACFAVFYWIIDVKGWKRWTTFFTVVGMNSITIYMAQRIIGFSAISKFFLGGLADLCSEPVGKVILSAGYLAVSWLFLYFLYRKKVFLKV